MFQAMLSLLMVAGWVGKLMTKIRGGFYFPILYIEELNKYEKCLKDELFQTIYPT